MPSNDPIVFPLSGFVAVKDVECFDEKQSIWKGILVKVPQQQHPFNIIYFSREYLPEVNELDQIIKEKTFDETLTGFSFLLVPKEKLIFGYHPKGAILMPDVGMLGKTKRPQI